ncbi:cysteinyl-tRNA synthetase [Galdieria sulphuraria]|uniref:cysteine--tRNA ligase n=1 Tax=Galdieria sulphuraria TaxID=130081 RepID=M2W702_GALSU|nr:cysteinyl-tRNA synthetase [Galdieria sulphuraria]EME31591.1 cysteinyl-tRNA synthetase [Galdieria sulphuraria]|eukprot:XP_005708111.1 cysteinyl-tRNA synthetase [Galdieria sulphuraria]
MYLDGFQLLSKLHCNKFAYSKRIFRLKSRCSRFRRLPKIYACECSSSSSSSLFLFNSKTRKKELFTSLRPNLVYFYSCGPTVYDFAHIGNFRAFITYDLIKRWLFTLGYRVVHVLNITDVDDKIIHRALKEKRPAKEITDFYTEQFFKDMQRLNCLPADHYPRATSHIAEMCALIDKLVKNGFAYVSNGSVYFSVDKYARYGIFTLSPLSISQTLTEEEETDKLNPSDFVLWKKYKEEDHNIFWNSQYGKGRPGWHLECSCMALHYLGSEIDIHAGGVDLMFPHHENEIAQAEAITGKTFVRYWIHNGFVQVNEQKMSKSLQNIKKLGDIAVTALDIRAFRYLIVSSHYRAPLSFHQDALKGAKNTIRRLDHFMNKISMACKDDRLPSYLESEDRICEHLVKDTWRRFQNEMNDDLNTPRAVASIWFEANRKVHKTGRLCFRYILFPTRLENNR